MTVRRFVQISTGLGAGNIGDEFMARAFWDSLPGAVTLEVEMFPQYTEQREPYPEEHHYFLTDWDGATTIPESMSGLLVGGTPVADWQGLHFPLAFLARRLERFHRSGRAVHASGVGVDRLEQAEARAIFAQAFKPIRTWTVRSARCRAALLELGVPAERILVGADWAWLYRRRRDLRDWGAVEWRQLGIDVRTPLIVANVVNEKWAGHEQRKGCLAKALDQLATRHGFQVAFFCNEMRDGEFFDRAAAEQVQARMQTRAALVPNRYWSPDEALGLLAHPTVTLSERYHFTVESILAGTVPVNLVRGQKMAGLVEELDLEPAGTIDQCDPDRVAAAVVRAAQERAALLARLEKARRALEARATNNLALVQLSDET